VCNAPCFSAPDIGDDLRRHRSLKSLHRRVRHAVLRKRGKAPRSPVGPPLRHAPPRAAMPRESDLDHRGSPCAFRLDRVGVDHKGQPTGRVRFACGLPDAVDPRRLPAESARDVKKCRPDPARPPVRPDAVCKGCAAASGPANWRPQPFAHPRAFGTNGARPVSRNLEYTAMSGIILRARGPFWIDVHAC